ncbi:MAG: 2-C-methyl-D-erythritol 4-phosphate cytidylyltransferase, partial [Clostridiales bacterium]|nr:2-C-methyl-D-erythritol 4-phosphate cytidylyltransferase [Clostridiales bacterium]
IRFYDNMSEDEFEMYTDACTVFIKNGKKPAMVMGSRDNIKLTYPEDLEKAEGIIARQNAKGERINP